MASDAPVLSKYERVQLVAGRVEQLLAGAPRLIDDLDTDDVTAIAEEEIARRILPVRIARILPNNKKRILDLRDFIDPDAAPVSTAPVVQQRRPEQMQSQQPQEEEEEEDASTEDQEEVDTGGSS